MDPNIILAVISEWWRTSGRYQWEDFWKSHSVCTPKRLEGETKRLDGNIKIEPTVLHLRPGEESDFKIIEKSHSAKISWSAPSDVVCVDSFGRIKALKEGEAYVYVTLLGNDKYTFASQCLHVIVKASDTISIAILGMPGAGKTTLLHFLQGLPESKEVFVTPDEGLDYNEYIYCKKDGTKVPIASGKDISGVEYAQKEYPPLIRGNDIILFLFSLKKYAFDSSYKAKVQSRLDLIKALLERKKLIVFLTFEEEFGIETQVREKESLKAYRQYQHEIGAKTYAAILEYPHHIISLKYGEDKSKLKMIIDQLL